MNWAVPRSLAATEGISVDFCSYGYLDVSVPRVRLLSLWVQDKIPFSIARKQWVTPFGDRRIDAGLLTPRRFSQATTSFVASDCLGIRRVRFVT